MSDLVGRTFGNYTILDLIGQGGMATVYRARDVRDQKIVAIKVLSPYVAADPKFRGRFDREISLLRKLQHPNIVPILAYGQVEGYHYIVMPYMPTGTLHERLRRGPILPLEGARILEQVASAVDYAHQQGVVHRDVKPSNMLLDEEGNVLLTDFGFAHVPWDNANLTGSLLIGTPAYMSPEQCRGEAIGPKSDQYSLGVVLYQMATGRLPYDSDTPMGVVIKQASQPLPSPRSVNPNLPEPVEEVLLKVLDKNPAGRYASVAEFNQAFQHALKMSLDPTGTYRLRQIRAERPTEVLSRSEVLRGWAREFGRRARRYAPLLATVFLLGCPAAAWGFGILPPLWENTPTGASASEDLLATIQALSTLNAPGEGTFVAPGSLETSVAGTLTAMGVSLVPTELAALIDPSLVPPIASTPTPTPTFALGGGGPYYRTRTPTPTGGGGYGSVEPVATSTPTVTGPVPTTPVPPTSTDTVMPPTDTPVPPPTDTPIPSPTKTKPNPPSCRVQGQTCTPTPG